MYVPGRAESNKENENKIERRAGPLPEVEVNQLCWHLGASRGDIANLKSEDLDWTNGTMFSFGKRPSVAGAG